MLNGSLPPQKTGGSDLFLKVSREKAFYLIGIDGG